MKLFEDMRLCLAWMADEYHDAAIVANDEHPAVVIELCTDELCAEARKLLSDAEVETNERIAFAYVPLTTTMT